MGYILLIYIYIYIHIIYPFVDAYISSSSYGNLFVPVVGKEGASDFSLDISGGTSLRRSLVVYEERCAAKQLKVRMVIPWWYRTSERWQGASEVGGGRGEILDIIPEVEQRVYYEKLIRAP